MLVRIYGCRYVDGRAASAPKERKGASSKFTLADHARELNAADSPTVDDDVILPHVLWSDDGDELNRRYPTCGVPEDANIEDGREREADRSDSTLQRGLRIAKTIREEMLRIGRVKHMPNEPTHCAVTSPLSELASVPNSCTPSRCPKVCPLRPRELLSHGLRRSVGKGHPFLI